MCQAVPSLDFAFVSSALQQMPEAQSLLASLFVSVASKGPPLPPGTGRDGIFCKVPVSSFRFYCWGSGEWGLDPGVEGRMNGTERVFLRGCGGYSNGSELSENMICYDPLHRRGKGKVDSPHSRLLHLGTEQQVGEEEDVPKLPGVFRHLHQEAILHQLTGLEEQRMSLLVVQPTRTQS